MSDIENIKRLINCKYDYINDIITEDNKLSLLYVLQPEEYEELVINNISDNFKYLIGCNYSYVINKQRINRFSLRKDLLISKYGCDPKMTEKEFCNSKGWYRIYDCGCLCYKWEK